MSLPPNKDYAPSTYLKDTKTTNAYVETGIYRGDSLKLAHEAGFSTIVGIENDPLYIEFCKMRFSIRGTEPILGQLKLIEGDSAAVLWDAIKDINEPITFFLDSHWQMLEGTEPGSTPFPLLKELEQIARHPLCKEHKIIIDDWHIFYVDRVGYSKQDILNTLGAMGLERHQLIANPVIDGICVAQKW